MKFKWYGQQLKTNLKYAISHTLNELGDQSVFEIRQSFPPGNYRRWRSRKPGVKWHWSSRPGQPPSVDTADLLESIRYDLIHENQGEVLRVGGYTDYALSVELGKASKRVHPRPYLYPQLLRLEKVAMSVLNKNTQQILR